VPSVAKAGAAHAPNAESASTIAMIRNLTTLEFGTNRRQLKQICVK
jgi:hypothetical protein